ncbi:MULTISPECIES: hypothetical protein [unclassified Streptomyces]|uniref:hypothetical protein n=1 Tax=unclassified Streptomyces TaxID=2593676 RepID=UPI0036B90916
MIATAFPVTGAAGAPVLDGLMGMVMLGIGEVPGAVPAGFAGPVAPGVPAVWC